MAPRGRPRLDIRASPYLAAAAFTLALEARYRVRFNPAIGKNEPMSRRAATRLAALAAQGSPIVEDVKSVARVRSDGRGGLYEFERPISHSAHGRLEHVEAAEQSIRRVIEAAVRSPEDHAVLDDLHSDILAIMLDRDAERAGRRIDDALGDAAPAFRAQMTALMRALGTV